jgi:hypothetical protein
MVNEVDLQVFDLTIVWYPSIIYFTFFFIRMGFLSGNYNVQKCNKENVIQDFGVHFVAK